MDCLFCKIANHQMECRQCYEDDDMIAFHDIAPQAPQHILLMPKKHFSTLNDVTSADASLMGKMLHQVPQIAKKLNIHESGYRTVVNCNQDGGQTVYHLHIHIMGGAKLGGSMVG